MIYKRILVPFKKSSSKIPLEVYLQNFKDNFGFSLPKSYVAMLSECNGGDLESVYIQYKNNTDEYEYESVLDLRGFGYYQDLSDTNYSHRSDFIGEGFGDLVTALENYISHYNLEKRFKKDKIVPSYFFSDDFDKYDFYRDLKKYIRKLDNLIEGLDLEEHYSHRNLKESYEYVKFFAMSVEISPNDGHYRFYLYYGDINKKKPSVYCGVDLSSFFKVADSFDDFIKNLVVARNSICFGINSLTESVFDFISLLIEKEQFTEGNSFISPELKEKILNCTNYIDIGCNKEIDISIKKNKLNDGFRKVYYEDFEYILEIYIKRLNNYEVYYQSSFNDKFVQHYEKQVVELYNSSNKSDIVLLHSIGISKLYDELFNVYKENL